MEVIGISTGGGPNDAGEAWLLDGLRDHRVDSSSAAVDAVRALGGSLHDVGSTPRRKLGKRQALVRAGQALGESTSIEQRKKDEKRVWLATEWRYLVVARCTRRKERARLVALLEENLDGTEAELPEWISDSVVKILAFARRQPPDVDGALAPHDLYRQLAEQWRQSQDAAS
jgi:hypothetical protein